jgi:hypothetical protein
LPPVFAVAFVFFFDLAGGDFHHLNGSAYNVSGAFLAFRSGRH